MPVKATHIAAQGGVDAKPVAIRAKDFSTVGSDAIEFHLWELRAERTISDVSIVIRGCKDEDEARVALDKFLKTLSQGKRALRAAERRAIALENRGIRK